MSSLSIIVAVAQNGAIGKNNDLLWHISEDLKYFKSKTLDHTVVMGYNTYLSLPVRPFPKRRNVIICDDLSINLEGCHMARSIEEAVALAEGETFICGGASIYRQFMPLAHRLYLTRVYEDFDADTFFPEIDMKHWHLVWEDMQRHDPKSGLEFQFQIFERCV